MSNDGFNDFYDISSSEDYHESGRSSSSHMEEDQRQLVEHQRREKERKEKETEDERKRLYDETYGPVNKLIEHWRSKKDDYNTRVIVKIINNTSHAFKLTQLSRRVTEEERSTLHLQPHQPNALLLHYKYDAFSVGWQKKESPIKARFQHFINYSGEATEFQADIGLTVTGRLGVYTIQHTHSVKSIGKTKINCHSNITRRSDLPPFNFEVLITLGMT